MLEGHLLSERYRIKKRIGGGGMANVYLANDIILNREVAIKVMRLEFANDQEFIERFDREAQAATSLSHPNIVNIYDVGEDNHILYMVMEYVDGPTLKEYIQQNGPIEVEKALDIMKQITSAISHAHAYNIVHRDIKPQNILIDRYGNVKVTDFGIAIALSATALTQTNSILGSVHYLSPEQARGGMATKKSDIYSLGIVLFELLTGRLPFSGQSPISIALKHLQNDTPSIKRFNPDIPQSVENIVLKATTKDPFHRYRNVQEMEDALATALDSEKMNEPVYTPPVEAGEETKAIPIITDDKINYDTNEDTIVHQGDEETIKHPVDKKPDKQPKKKKKGWLKWAVASLSLIVLLAIVFLALQLISPKDVVVPDVADMEYEEAVKELESVNLMTEKKLIHSDEIEIDYVIKTDPPAGRTVKEKSTITVYVSQGEEKVVFENYVGKQFDQVKRVLEESGYEEVISYDKPSDKPVGEIISQIQPEVGKEVIPRETTVIFEISKGPDLISLNNLKGLTVKEVEEYVEKHGLKVNINEEFSDTVEKNVVIRQTPEANTEINIGDTITVYVSKGPEGDPPKSHSVTFTVPFQPKDGESKQTVLIYIDDMNNKLSHVYKEETITKDSEFTITLTIEPDKVAEYKVVRDGDVIINKSVSYKEGG